MANDAFTDQPSRLSGGQDVLAPTDEERFEADTLLEGLPKEVEDSEVIDHEAEAGRIVRSAKDLDSLIKNQANLSREPITQEINVDLEGRVF